MVERPVRIQNPEGLHARPAALFAQTASRFASEVRILTDRREINAKSVLGVMSLAAVRGTLLLIRADGPDQEEAVRVLAGLVEDGFRAAY